MLLFSAMPPSDTSPRAAALQIELYRKLGTARRTQIAADLSDAVRETAVAGVRRRHPEYKEEEVRRALIEMLYGARGGQE